MIKWTKEEEIFLISHYSNMTNENISKILNKTINSIDNKRKKLKLKKDKKHIQKNITNRNKIIGRNLSFENILNIAKQYKSRSEFQKMDASAYSTCRKNGYLDVACKHMIKNKYSIPQLLLREICKIIIDNDILYDNRKIIHPYELDIFIPKYNIAFEYDGKKWHKNNKNDKLKNKLCEHNNIKLIRIVENDRKYEQDIKNQLINKLNEINQYCKLDIKKEDILNIDNIKLYSIINKTILNDEDVKNIILKYNNYKDFRINEPKIYEKLKKIKRLDEFTSHLKRSIVKWDDNKIDTEISKYKYLSDFIKMSNSCYLYILRHNLKHKLLKLKRKKNH